MILALDIGGTFIKWAVADGYELIVKGKVPTPRDSFESLINAIRNILEQNQAYDIKGTAVSYPGMADPQTGKLVPIGALDYGFHLPVEKMLEKALGMHVSLENDGRLAALAEAESGSLKGVDSGYMLVVGTGIGGAYVKNGKVETGSHGYAGQASLILMGDIRTQGLSTLFSSRTGMAAFLISAAEQMNRESISGEEFMALVKSGDQKATALFDQYMNDFTNTLFTLQMLFDPEVFVIGGGISADEYYISSMQEKYEELYEMFRLALPHAEIRPAVYRNDANIMGALSLFYSQHGDIR